MVQTERRIIRQLQKDSPVIFLLPLLLMLMAIHVIYGCECQEVDWQRVMCPEENKTVLLGNEISVSRVSLPGSSEVTAVHQVEVQKMFKDGLYNLTLLSRQIFVMITPHNCSYAPKDNTTMYIISGDTDAGGVLHSSNCTIVPIKGFFEQRKNLTNIYWGGESPKC